MAENKEEVVISGIGGLFPESNNITELSDLLFKKINGVTIDSRRWKPGVYNFFFFFTTVLNCIN